MGRELPEQWVAVGDVEWLTWARPAANPFLNMAAHQGLAVEEWRDPFIFQEQGRTFMVLGGKIGTEPVTLIYEKGTDALTWTYQGVLFRHPRTDFTSLECPNFFKLRDTWVLLDSPFGPVEYFMGAFDLTTFTFAPTSQGLVDHSPHFYATNLFFEDQGRAILVGWIRGFPIEKGWNGCLSLPRVLSISDDGHLRQQPVAELQKLRGRHTQLAPRELRNASQRLADVNVMQSEIQVQFELQDARDCGVKIGGTPDHGSEIVIRYDGAALHIGAEQIPLNLSGKTDVLTLHIFLDRSVLELFVNDGQWCFTQVISAPVEARGVEVFAQHGAVTLRQCDIWDMQAVW